MTGGPVFPGRAGGRRSRPSKLTRGMMVVDRLGAGSDAINAEIGGAAAGESEGAEGLWTLDSTWFMVKAALAT